MMAGCRARALAVVLALVSCSPAAPSSGTPSSGTPPASTTLARAVVDLVNVERTRAGRAPLREDVRLTRAAQLQADQMARAGRLDHELPGTPHPRLQDRISAVDYEWQAIGENLAYGQGTAAAVVADWMGSSAHRGNILNPSFTETGVAHATGANGRTYFAQVFARPH